MVIFVRLKDQTDFMTLKVKTTLLSDILTKYQ